MLRPGLTSRGLGNVVARAVQPAALPRSDGGRVASGLHAVTAGLEAIDLDVLVVEERGEQPDRVRAATDAGGDRVRQYAVLVEALLAGLVTDAAAEVTDHAGERVRASGGAEQVCRGVDAGHPVAQGRVVGVL